MNLQDTLYNWVQIKLVANARPEDNAAKETCDFFEQILFEDHKLTSIAIDRKDDTMLHIAYEQGDGSKKKKMFNIEDCEQLLQDINSNPKYN